MILENHWELVYIKNSKKYDYNLPADKTVLIIAHTDF
ncbi:hypothetical protein Toce_0677 [Thermosediminibacter oceani DSM 16646]|uniref:Uncharacterized protein n=1 Tax=Thermosediminibacter oceani (strain ATCC BAA-1034 / DSM 16646 / JW/IW-1228P) TaxID=555079 RepID=D9S221_THEOJ|nr:hypothetical protein Toce_0677 [Thermosediminibacter oceani DSM 16646]